MNETTTRNLTAGSFIRDKPLSQTPSAIRHRQLRLNDDPKAAQYAESLRKYIGMKRDAKLRIGVAGNVIDVKTPRWNEIAHLHAAGRDTGRIAIYLNMPEWIVKILVQHIDMTNAGQGTASQNLEAANKAIKTIKIKGQQ
jgi:hypothetical protein